MEYRYFHLRVPREFGGENCSVSTAISCLLQNRKAISNSHLQIYMLVTGRFVWGLLMSLKTPFICIIVIPLGFFLSAKADALKTKLYPDSNCSRQL